MRTDTAHERFEARDDDWLPAQRRDNPSPAERRDGPLGMRTVNPPILMATLMGPPRLVHVTMALVPDAAAVYGPRVVLDVRGEVTRTVSEPLPAVLVGRAAATSQRFITGIIARYLANAEAGRPEHGRSLYA